MTREAVIVEAVRTPLGKRNGKLSGWHPVDLLAEVLNETVARSSIDATLVDDVICGCVSQVGEQSLNVGRNAWLAADLPEEVPATTVDRQCGSSQQAAHFAAQGVIAGAYDLAIACGVESMSRVPMGSSAQAPGFPFPDSLMGRYEGGLVPQGISAEIISERWSITREEADQFGARSHERALKRPRPEPSRTRSSRSRSKTISSRSMRESERLISRRWPLCRPPSRRTAS